MNIPSLAIENDFFEKELTQGEYELIDKNIPINQKIFC